MGAKGRNFLMGIVLALANYEVLVKKKLFFSVSTSLAAIDVFQFRNFPAEPIYTMGEEVIRKELPKISDKTVSGFSDLKKDNGAFHYLFF